MTISQKHLCDALNVFRLLPFWLPRDTHGLDFHFNLSSSCSFICSFSFSFSALNCWGWSPNGLGLISTKFQCVASQAMGCLVLGALWLTVQIWKPGGQKYHCTVTNCWLFLCLSNHVHPSSQVATKNWKKQLIKQGYWNALRLLSDSRRLVCLSCFDPTGWGKTLPKRFWITWNKTSLHIPLSHITS